MPCLMPGSTGPLSHCLPWRAAVCGSAPACGLRVTTLSWPSACLPAAAAQPPLSERIPSTQRVSYGFPRDQLEALCAFQCISSAPMAWIDILCLWPSIMSPQSLELISGCISTRMFQSHCGQTWPPISSTSSRVTVSPAIQCLPEARERVGMPAGLTLHLTLLQQATASHLSLPDLFSVARKIF